ncbi:hypothetical protein EWM64_g5524 [Hericium alpestre]|uniref:Uncharacterized protein n=1 Tax=Hericium alpestre TaxID=135208 RepID=A0A4Y9ZYB8_9AGAM|nr:hypothetical protein EWM64_g5524 [Hericium alpestre]
MSLDQNLFTLTIAQHKDDPAVIDLTDPAGVVHYRKQREPGPVYKINVFEPLSESLLASATAPSATSKHKTVELYNPEQVVELKSIGTLSFKWGFKWEDHDFEWKREECYMIRKPDPAVLVAVTKEPPGKLKSTAIQILDYNINRFDIEDRKGFEIVLLTALLTFHDMNDTWHTPPDPVPEPSPPRAKRATSIDAPAVPPRPAKKTGVDRIEEMQNLRGEVNEIAVEEEGSVNDYAAYAANLFEDEAMLFISIRSSDSSYVPKVLKVVEQTKRLRHKRGQGSETELHQYVLLDKSSPGSRRIVLDDAPRSGGNYTPPESVVVHLSKIPMPELQPKPVRERSTTPERSGTSGQDRQAKKKDKGKSKETDVFLSHSDGAGPTTSSTRTLAGAAE